MAELIVVAVLVAFALFVAAKTVRIIPQARAGVVERLGRYSRTLSRAWRSSSRSSIACAR